MKNDNISQILKKIRSLTGAYRGEENPLNRLDWLQSLISAYEKYLPMRVIEKIKIDPTANRIEGERRYITVLFADLSGFTALSETMDAEDIARIINDFFARMVKIVHKYGGSVDKFLGDALMVLFGAPVTHHDDPERAVRAALEMQEEMERFNAEKKFPSPLSMSIGINTGPAVALNVGSDERMEYTVIGDTVNLAARLESVSGPKEIIISIFTYEKIADFIDAEKRPSVKVKGKKKPVVNYLVKGIQEHYRLPEITKIKFVGREPELEVVKKTIIQTRNNVLKVIGVGGEPGSGKTRFGIESELIASENDYVTFAVRCVPYEMNIPYNTFVQFFNNYFRFKKNVTEEEKKLLISLKLKELGFSLDDILPYLGILYGMDFAETESLPPDELKRRIFSTIKIIFEKESSKKPIFMRIEDLQWIDPTSLEVFDYLLKELKEHPILFFFEYRADYAFPYLSYENCQNIFLKNLNKDQVNSLIESMLEHTNVAEEINNLVFEKSSGNPLFTTEIVKVLVKKNGIRKTKEGIVTTERFRKLDIAESVSSVILDQIDRMSEYDKRILQYASIIGRSFEPGLLTTLLKIPVQNLLADLERLEHFEGALFLNQNTNTYDFTSPTTYEVVYGSLLKHKRKELHTIIGGELEKTPKEAIFENLEKLAYHFTRSSDELKGVYYLKSAADKSYHFYALRETLTFFEQALELLNRKELSSEETRDKLEILRRQGLILRLLGNLSEAIKKQRESLRFARKQSSLKDEAGAYVNIGKIYEELGIPQKAFNYWTKAKGIANKINDKQIEILAENNIATSYLQTGNISKAYDSFLSVLKLSEDIGDKRGIAFANLNLGTVMEKRGDFARALNYYEKAYASFEDTGDKENALRSLHQMAIARMLSGDLQACLKDFNNVAELSAKYGDRMMESLALGSIGEVYGRMWQLDKAYDKFLQSLSIAQMVGEPQQKIVLNINIGDVHFYQGSLDQAIEYHKKAIEIAAQIQDPFNEALARRSLGWDFYYCADYIKARDEFETSKNIFQKIGDKRNSIISMLVQMAIDIKLGNIEETEQIVRDIEQKARAMNDLEIISLALDIRTDAFFYKDDYETATKILIELFEITKQTNNKRGFAWVNAKMGDTILRKTSSFSKNDKDILLEVGKYLEQSLTLARELGDRILELHAYILNAEILLRKSDFMNSLNVLIKGTDLANQCGAREFYARILLLMSQIYEKFGDNKESKDYLLRHKKLVNNITEDLNNRGKKNYYDRIFNRLF